MKRANDEVVVVVMIETKEAVAAIDEILAVQGVDGVFIGPYDLSLSYGIPGKTSDPVMVDAKRKIVGACRRAKKSRGSAPGQTRRGEPSAPPSMRIQLHGPGDGQPLHRKRSQNRARTGPRREKNLRKRE